MQIQKTLTTITTTTALFLTLLAAGAAKAQPSTQQEKLQNMVCKRFGVYERSIPRVLPEFTARAAFEAIVKGSTPAKSSPEMDAYLRSIKKDAISIGTEAGERAARAMNGLLNDLSQNQCDHTHDLTGPPTRDNVSLIVCGRLDAYQEVWTQAAADAFVDEMYAALAERSAAAGVDPREAAAYNEQAAWDAALQATAMIEKRFTQGRSRLCDALEQAAIDESPVLISEHGPNDHRFPGEQQPLPLGQSTVFEFGVSTIEVREGFVAKVTDRFGFTQTFVGPIETFVGQQSNDQIVEIEIVDKAAHDRDVLRAELLAAEADLIGELDWAKGERDQAAGDMADAWDRLMIVDAPIRSIEPQLNAKRRELEVAEEPIQVILELIRQLESAAAEAQATANQYPKWSPLRLPFEAQVAALNTQIGMQRVVLEGMMGPFDALRDEYYAMGRAYQELLDEKAQAENDLATAENDYQQFVNYISSLEGTLADVRAELAQL